MRKQNTKSSPKAQQNPKTELAQARKKIEALERQAQIEAALERVRTRTMAMRNSDELAETAGVLFEQMVGLGIIPKRCVIGIIDSASESAKLWFTSSNGKVLPGSDSVPLTVHENLVALFHSWQNKEDLYTFELIGEARAVWTRYVTEKAKMRLPEYQPDKIDQKQILTEPAVFNSFFFSHGFVMLHTVEHLAKASFTMLKRFARVFEQTYTRFLDLKQAESQAREAQIEAALERVRAKAMAMHKSEDLNMAVATVFDELEKLNLGMSRCGIGILDKEKRSADVFTTSKSEQGNAVQVSGDESMDIHPLLQGAFDAWLKQGDFSYVLQGEDLADYYRALGKTNFRLPESQSMVERAEQLQQHYYVATFEAGGLFAFRETAFPEEAKVVMKRFAGVFNLTYKRFLDIQKAEAQAREAQIEAALERVRSRAMAMQTSEELKALIGTVFTELTKLELVLTRSVIIIYESDTYTCLWWMANSESASRPMNFLVKYDEQPFFQAYRKGWQEKNLKWVFELEGEDKVKTDDFLFNETELSLLPDFVIAGMRAPNKVWLSASFNNFGCLTLASLEPLPEEHFDILLRFAKVFDLTYTRFNDLKQAEARAREAEQQASLDRVRAEIASMRTTDDLQRITPLIWRELTTLGVPFFRCGIFIIDEATEQAHVYLSTPSGEAVAALHMKFESAPVIKAAVQHWRQQQVYREEWNREQFIAWTQPLIEQRQIDSPKKYQAGEEAPERLVLQFVPFTQGMLYIGSHATLSDDEIEVGQALAKAFGVAYSRYEDFQRLEAAKKEVEVALDDLKKTQSQLVQAEKMASLGQLTAGIAHEIKNPLNFVNNFAQLSTELTDEFVEKLDANADKTIAEVRYELNDLLADLRTNNAKINEHGKRADSIVKSMMQHARGGKGECQPTDVNALVEEYINLTYHGMRAKVLDFNVSIERDFGKIDGKVEMVPQEIGRVLLNLLGNAFDAVREQKQPADGAYSPKVTVATRSVNGHVEIRVSDNGCGIPDELREKIFEPFFTTKPTGSGTGLGLSLSYDIITQAHGGTLTMESTSGEGATFIITLPAR